jgi:HYR domain
LRQRERPIPGPRIMCGPVLGRSALYPDTLWTRIPCLQHKRRILVLTIGALALVAAVAATTGRATRTAQTGSLTLSAPLTVLSMLIACPPDAPPTATICVTRTGGGLVHGLGRVTETYTFFAHDCGGSYRMLETSARLEVEGKGALQVALDRDDQCRPSFFVANRPFRITGGSGLYAGASGGGTLAHNHRFDGRGNDTWAGTLSVSGLEFDVEPPTINGAVGKTVRVARRAKRVRVTYRVTASDAVDGPVSVACVPRSGTRFKVGRTTVKCTASDSSANVKTARFTVTVKRRR